MCTSTCTLRVVWILWLSDQPVQRVQVVYPVAWVRLDAHTYDREYAYAGTRARARARADSDHSGPSAHVHVGPDQAP